MQSNVVPSLSWNPFSQWQCGAIVDLLAPEAQVLHYVLLKRHDSHFNEQSNIKYNIII